MDTASFGNTGEKLSRIGLGCFSMSGAYGAGDDGESIATIHRAIDLGVTLLDTSASYGQGHNHRLIGEALKGGKREKVFIHSKTGTVRANDGSSVAQGSGTPDRLRLICETSLKNQCGLARTNWYVRVKERLPLAERTRRPRRTRVNRAVSHRSAVRPREHAEVRARPSLASIAR